MQVQANGIGIEVEDSGGSGPCVLLVMGLGMQLIAWPPAFVQALVDAGFRVVRFDNRDIGLSTHFDGKGLPNVLWETVKLRLGFGVRAPYTLEDMGRDALGVLDALGIGQAHVVGVSMGGMIAQRVALTAPQRVKSLTSIMSTSGARGLPEPRPHVIRALIGRPAGPGREAVIDHYIKLFGVIGSPAWPQPEAAMRERIGAGVDRSHHPAGTLRQLVAVAADTGIRAQQLGRITAPTLVMHGKSDPLVPFPCGEDTASRIPGARFVGIEGMGHDLPPEAVERVLQALVPFLQSHEHP
ncbi:MAG: alpha/beta fold hydrolase [Burkholderiaceae bacterium]